MLIGDAGTGVGSRIGGHVRRGGKKMRVEHMKHTVVGITSEYRTSQTCAVCFQQLHQARYRRTINGEERIVSVHGAMECQNPDCPSFLQGRSIKPRDVNAAMNIAMAGASTLLHNRELPPFSRSAQTKNTGQIPEPKPKLGKST
ncbi:MAG: hypothetical protein J3Q66DRAFT_280018 [Benniella sp.]|nr:MAG: hypothetical protein J3Q66DRAFT_280018 [Benniella sp.]